MNILSPLDCWQALINTAWILAPPNPYEWLCSCQECPSTESLPEPPKQLPAPVSQETGLDEALMELTPLPALTDATQGWLMSADPPIDIITFL